ncbi:iron complex outermembrane recepter protein [Roseateles sp. YR242]|uniref:TonB-dependent siderophore receptor n=1 Tax=Roseateles sp. YR242 TaxID=1855305 RepID=UPI0008AFAFDE|nr:TonB-dependent receptor [Roseateles sp. YR242]SEK53988.1 iron complex outermembrane recepter protein [Roseateles sp. YR242]
MASSFFPFSPAAFARRPTTLAAALLAAGVGANAWAQTASDTTSPARTAGANTAASSSATTNTSAGANSNSSSSNTTTGTPLPIVTVRGSNAQSALTVGGFGETPVAKLPLQASVITSDQLADRGLSTLAGLTSIDASVGDSYNSEGYVSYLKIRGYDLDNRFNYRRDGLPINAETALPLSNKSSIEVLKGTSGIQAGTSAPGGLVNLVVKRPTVELTSVTLGVSGSGTVEGALDWSHRFSDAYGHNSAFGLRVNLAAAHLDPELHDAKGKRWLMAVAGDWRVSPDTLVEAEVELNRQSQPSQAGFSLLGTTLPDAHSIDPRTNLNNQAWSQPVVFEGRTASLRVQHQLNADWKLQAHGAVQRLVTDDRLAYPFGCTASDGTYWASSYCPDGTFDQYDFRSDNEHRNSSALDLSAQGKLRLADMSHELSTGVLFSRFYSRLQGQAYNWAGTGDITGSLPTVADPTLSGANTDRDERSTEFYLRDAVQLSPRWQGWLGVRHTRLRRDSFQVNVEAGEEARTNYRQSVTTPWLGLSYAIDPELMAYASWGEGVESDVVPNRAEYVNQGQALPAMRSRQWEIGLKAGNRSVDWSVNYFDVTKPTWSDVAVDTAGNLQRRLDGTQDHRGFEGQADFKWSSGGLQASAMKLHARRHGSTDTSLDGLKPVNVPETTAKLLARQRVGLPGLELQAGLVYEGRRMVLPDNSLSIPSWTRVDLGARYEQALGRQTLVWRVGVDNVTNRRAWRESPYQYEHVYLYPLAVRTWRASVEWLL